MSSPTPFHRIFGLTWIDFFEGTDIEVETELDLSIKKQLIDLVIIRKKSEPLPRRLPDGFEILAHFNLVTFKSSQETLDNWTLLELIGHFVNYCKRISPSLDSLLPQSDFRLFAVSARFPAKLAKQVNLSFISPGVYDVEGFGLVIRVIVLYELPMVEHNAMLHLFSAQEELIGYGQEHYSPHSPETSTLIYQLLKAYCEDQTMSEKLKAFVRESIEELLKSLPPEQIRNALPVEERLKGLPVGERLKGVSADELIQSLSPEMLEALARGLKANGSSSKPNQT